MLSETKIKAIALGNKATLQRLNTFVDSFVVEIHTVSDINQALYLLHRNDFDIILIDSFFDGTEPTTGILRKASLAPIALLIGDSESEWENFRFIEVDGFIPKEAGQPEFYARLKAISRRRLPSRQHN